MASLGHEVIGADIDEGKESPAEPGKGLAPRADLDPMLADNIAAGRLRFTTNFAEGAPSPPSIRRGGHARATVDGTYEHVESGRGCPRPSRTCKGDCLIIGKSTGDARHRGRASRAWRTASLGPGRVGSRWRGTLSSSEGCAVADTRPTRRSSSGAVTGRGRDDPGTRPTQTDAGIPPALTDLPTSELARARPTLLATKISSSTRWRTSARLPTVTSPRLAEPAGPGPRIGKAFLRAVGHGRPACPRTSGPGHSRPRSAAQRGGLLGRWTPSTRRRNAQRSSLV